MARAAKRFSVECVHAGRLALSDAESHHARVVMRLQPGDVVEVFDPEGRSAEAAILATDPRVEVDVQTIRYAAERRLHLTVASAIPKGARADWLVEKLSEIGVECLVPLQTARSVVHPEGASKTQRWERLAAEATKQSRRTGSLEISPLSSLKDLLGRPRPATWHLSTVPGSLPLAVAVAQLADAHGLLLLIGPEGGWSEEEELLLRGAGSVAVALTESILRVETAGLVAAGALLSLCRD